MFHAIQVWCVMLCCTVKVWLYLCVILFFCCTCVIVYCALNRCWCVMCCTVVIVGGFHAVQLWSPVTLYFMLYRYKCVTLDRCGCVRLCFVLFRCGCGSCSTDYGCDMLCFMYRCGCVMLCFMLYRRGCVMLNRCDSGCVILCALMYRCDCGWVSCVMLFVFVQVRAWVLSVGFTLSFGSMFSKIWTVHQLTTTRKKDHKVTLPLLCSVLLPPPPPSLFDQTSRGHFKSMICQDVKEHLQDCNQQGQDKAFASEHSWSLAFYPIWPHPSLPPMCWDLGAVV